MYEQEKIKPYNGLGEKGRLVERMFDSIAPTYDTLNHRLSLNIDKGWRKRAIKQLLPFAPKTVLDIATGTGDFAILAAQMLQPSRLVGVDISQRMMDIGQKKVAEAELQGIISFEKEDCLSLSFADETFDAVTAAFGIRNFQDLDRGLTEMCRVLRKGGHLSIVELTAPISAPMRWLFKVYSHTFLPLYGRLISKDKEAYRYLTDTIEAFPQGDRMVDILRKAGFSKASYRRLTFGVCTMYFATK
ncbi:bifunctional demethylmenaquinone methyltransferase/2-methoxy-6-polyprenyl-1,4-benzoquinol methylase UbiE [Hoylesella pleuritidis]|uniref:bifunctional demethylmenaquinone methyltransferase/2-methoxy-6-polyprenyl-1,4-benzoquinol methylase UbiE n=1 Tax=Hoylesella pleuritidis TaxID=407975 RepID=UPI0023527434|nr:bifunctional demethylmenaquinone methyltransferase/2-methoxy-6-polyprenyl-1,4-benzoquinol methylase UbiE [Hoylesella pleuritidis]